MIYEALPELPDVDPSEVGSLGLVFKTHLDLGFTALARDVYRNYMEDFMPRACRLALETDAAFSRTGGKEDRFIWTTGSWLVAKYLEHAKGAALRDFESAIERGLIRWHALPFTFQTEALDESLLISALAISQRLDRRFGVNTIAAKMTDVPGHTRGMIPAFSAAGVRLLHIGVNPATPVPDVPPAFRWRHASGSELLMCYEGTYGGFCASPGRKDEVFAIAMTGDNAGPPTEASIAEVFEGLRVKFPQANVHASTLEELARSMLEGRDRLPVLTSEIGDTWIHGYGSDPWKMGAFRRLAAARRAWIAEGRFDPESDAGINFDENLLLSMEHTWGLDEKSWLNNGVPLSKVEDCYRRDEFEAARGRDDFRRMEASWAEQREYIQLAIAALPADSLRPRAVAALEPLKPQSEETQGMERLDNPKDFHAPFAGRELNLREDGALTSSDALDLVLGALSYEVFGEAEYEAFMLSYVSEAERNGIWAPFDFNKPGIGKVIQGRRSWRPEIRDVKVSKDGQRIIVESAFGEDAVAAFGAPARIRTIIDIRETGVLDFDLQWLEKPACRMPEALWFSFHLPVSEEAVWHMLKLGDAVEPRDVVSRGGRRLHIVQEGVEVTDRDVRWHLSSPDAALLAPGTPALVNFDNLPPNPSEEGVHFNLFNNTWGTNFPMWYEDDARFRFRLECVKA